MHVHSPRLTAHLAILDIGLPWPAARIQANGHALPAVRTGDLGFGVPGVVFLSTQMIVGIFWTGAGGKISHRGFSFSSDTRPDCCLADGRHRHRSRLGREDKPRRNGGRFLINTPAGEPASAQRRDRLFQEWDVYFGPLRLARFHERTLCIQDALGRQYRRRY